MSGRARKPNVKSPASKRQARDKLDPSTDPEHKNRRIVMVVRQVSPERGKGAVRTIIEVVPAENADWAEKIAAKYIEAGATVMTDEHPAYSQFSAVYEHQTVNHSLEFSTKTGVNNNQAESYLSIRPFRRARSLMSQAIEGGVRSRPVY